MTARKDTAAEECASEPIHIPGSIQPHGALLVLRGADFSVVQASANCAELFDRGIDALLGRPISELIESDDREPLASFLSGAEVGFANPFRVGIAAGGHRMDAIAHRVGERVVLELERLGGRSDDGGEVGPDVYLRLVQSTLANFATAESVDAFCQVAADAVFDFTGFDRVMVYRFEPDGHGVVVAETMAPDQTSFLGLHFPASDIPEQARNLYRVNWLRLIAAADYEAVPIVGMPGEDAEPLDLTHSVLRSVSPVHLEYLRNMGVAASMSISLVQGDKLWGLILCHHRSPRWVPYATRICATMLATVFSAQLLLKERALADSKDARLKAAYRRLADGVADSSSVGAALEARAGELMDLLSADGVAICFDSRIASAGSVPGEDGIREITELLGDLQPDPVMATDSAVRRFPSLGGKLGDIAGLLAMRVDDELLIIFFRRNRLLEVRWGGDPHAKVVRENDGRLGPRNSFAEFVEKTEGHSLPWCEAEIDAASAFQSALSGLIARRSRDYASLNRQITAKTDEMESFVYSVSHDLKSPLVTCRGFIGLMLEDLDEGDLEAVKDSAGRIDRAVQSLSCLVDALLDLSRIGQQAYPSDGVDVAGLLEEMAPGFTQRLTDAGARLVIADAIPGALADAMDTGRVFDNLISNAIKYGCPEPGHTVRVEGRLLEGAGMVRYCVSDDGPGIAPAYHRRVFQLFQRLSNDNEGTGVGLATVAKVARVNGGDAWVESSVGRGARFFFTLPAREPVSPVDRG